MDIYDSSTKNDTSQNKKRTCTLISNQYSYSDNSDSQTTHYQSISNGLFDDDIWCNTNINIGYITLTQSNNHVQHSDQHRSLNKGDDDPNKVSPILKNEVNDIDENNEDKDDNDDECVDQRTVSQNKLRQDSLNSSDYYDSTDTSSNSNSNSIKSKSSSTDIEIDRDYSILSNLSHIFIRRVKALRYVHELFCSSEYPDSDLFTGEEAILVIYSILNEKIPEAYCINIANALMKSRPALFEPVHYSQKSLINGTIYNTRDEIYRLHEDNISKGVMTSLTKCYTYGCKYEKGKNGCYSPLCPNKPEIFKYEFSTESNLSRKDTTISVISINKETSYPHKAWAERVPTELLEKITQHERDRQEAINEIIYSEEVYRNDLNTLHELVVAPLLKDKTIIKKTKARKEFLKQVFSNYNELRDISSALIKDLFRLQRRHKQKCIPSIGDVMIQHLRFFERPFTTYCSHIPLSEYILSNECKSNTKLDSFLNQVSKEDRFRRLPFRHFLLNPVTRMQRYKLLLLAVLKKTDQDHHDYPFLIRCIDIINGIAKKSDLGTIHFKKCVEIAQINDALIFNQGEMYDLQLDHTYRKQRRLYHQGGLNRKPINLSDKSSNNNNNNNNNNKPDIHLFVFDHVLLMAKLLISNTGDRIYHVWKKPILLDLLSIEGMDEDEGDVDSDDTRNNLGDGSGDEKTFFTLPNGPYLNKLTFLRRKSHDKNAQYYPLVLQHHDQGKKAYTFYCQSLEEKQSWVNAITKAKKALKMRHQSEKDLFKLRIIDDVFLVYTDGIGYGLPITASYKELATSS
ncbi:unnamed protein product [Cunninghamella blakesleeana]